MLQDCDPSRFGVAIALSAGLGSQRASVSSVYVHSGRTAETDALFALLILLTVVALWGAERQPWHRAWLGAIAAAVFLLRGMAVLMPVGIVLSVLIWKNWTTSGERPRWVPSLPTISGVILFVVPVGAWAFARWRVDQWTFFDKLFNYDFVARSLTVLEGYPGGPVLYVNILQRKINTTGFSPASRRWCCFRCPGRK